MDFTDIIKKYPEMCTETTQEPPTKEFERLPPFSLPSRKNLDTLSTKYNCSFPDSFYDFQTNYGKLIPYPESLGWAIEDIPPFHGIESLELILKESKISIAGLIPFARDDQGNYYCFDAFRFQGKGEYPIVYWDHDEQNIIDVDHYRWESFSCWILDYLESDDED